jgi:flagellar motility protein MotE (MotC chaperone)
MNHINKVIIFLGIYLISSIFFGSIDNSSYLNSNHLNPIFGDAIAEDEKKDGEKNPDGEGTEEDPCPDCPECPDPAKVVLRGLEDKKTQVEKQHKALLAERKELAVFEEQIDEKLENLKTLKKQIEDDLALLNKRKTQKEQEKEAAYETKIGRLVKMYAGMKPKSAAEIVNKMKLEVAQEIFLRMREASASEILASVDSEKAAKISERLASRMK